MSGTLELLVDGEKVKIDWLRSEPPTQADVDEIKNQIRSKRKPSHVAALSALGMSQGGTLGRANQFVNSAVSKKRKQGEGTRYLGGPGQDSRTGGGDQAPVGTTIDGGQYDIFPVIADWLKTAAKYTNVATAVPALGGPEIPVASKLQQGLTNQAIDTAVGSADPSSYVSMIGGATQPAKLAGELYDSSLGAILSGDPEKIGMGIVNTAGLLLMAGHGAGKGLAFAKKVRGLKTADAAARYAAANPKAFSDFKDQAMAFYQKSSPEPGFLSEAMSGLLGVKKQGMPGIDITAELANQKALPGSATPFEKFVPDYKKEQLASLKPTDERVDAFSDNPMVPILDKQFQEKFNKEGTAHDFAQRFQEELFSQHAQEQAMLKNFQKEGAQEGLTLIDTLGKKPGYYRFNLRNGKYFLEKHPKKQRMGFMEFRPYELHPETLDALLERTRLADDGTTVFLAPQLFELYKTDLAKGIIKEGDLPKWAQRKSEIAAQEFNGDYTAGGDRVMIPVDVVKSYMADLKRIAKQADYDTIKLVSEKYGLDEKLFRKYLDSPDPLSEVSSGSKGTRVELRGVDPEIQASRDKLASLEAPIKQPVKTAVSEPVKTGAPVTVKEEFKKIEPPSDVTTPAETPEALQHRHADLDELASEFDLIPHEKSSVPWATYVRDATVMLNHPDVVEARILKAKPKAIDAATNVAGHQIVKTLGEKANQLEDAGMTTEAAAFRDRAQAIFDKLYEGGSEAGRRLNAQRMFAPQFDEHRLGKMVETLTEKPLDDVQKTVINKNVRKVNDLTNRAAGRARDLINENVPRMNKQVPPSGFFARNKHFTEQMVSDAAARLLRKGSQASANPFAPLLDIETYRDLTTIGGGLIEAGYRKVEDFAVQMRDVLKDTGISLTDQELLGLQLDALRAFSRKSNIPGSMWGEDIMTGKQGGEFWGLADPEIRNIRKEIDSIKSQTMAWINQQRRTGFFEGLRIGLRTNRLTNPVARVKDLIGNLSVQVERQAGKASIDPLIDRLLFPKNEQAVLGFSWKRAQEVIGEGWGNRIKEEVVQQLKHGDIDLLHKFSGRKELNTGHPKFDAAVNSVTRFAGVTDVPFKDWIFRETLNDLAELKARAEAKTGGRVKDKAFIEARRKYHFENPSDDMLLMAENESITGVFGGDNLFTELNKAGEAWLSRQGEKGQAIGLVKDLIVQFPNIFSNISGYVTDFGVGAFKAGGREVARRLAKEPLTMAQQRLVTKLVSRNLKGVALYMLGKYLYDNGIVNPTINAKDGYVDWGDLGDTGGPFTVALYGATVAALDRSGLTDAQKQRIMWGTTVGLMADQPAIEGTGRALQAIRTQQGLVKYLSQTGASAIVPSLIREWARRQDSVKTTGNIFERQNRKVESPQDAMKNVLPFLRETLPPK